MVRTLADCEDIHERKLVQDVERVGWSLVLINEPPYTAFTIGLQHSFQHPELVIAGLTSEIAATILNMAGAAVKAGQRYEADREYDDLLENYLCKMALVDPQHYREELGFCRWFYRGDKFTALQILWPDTQQRYPDDPEFEERLRRLQPVFTAKTAK